MIEHTADFSKIIATRYYDDIYVLNFDKHSGKITLGEKWDVTTITRDKKWQIGETPAFSFSKTDKYFLVMEDGILYGYIYDGDFHFDEQPSPTMPMQAYQHGP